MTIAKELRDQEMFLRDAATIWCRYSPVAANEACIIRRRSVGDLTGNVTLSRVAQDLLEEFLVAEVASRSTGYTVAFWNDYGPSVTRQRVIDLLSEAADYAEECGL